MYIGKTSLFVIVLIIGVIFTFDSDAFDVENDVIFRLYTRGEDKMYYALKANDDEAPISNTPFNPNRPTRIFVHGFRSKPKVIVRYAEAYLKLGDFNFIAVDWTKGASTYNYYSAKGRVSGVRIINSKKNKHFIS